MKKILQIILISAVVLSLCSCNVILNGAADTVYSLLSSGMKDVEIEEKPEKPESNAEDSIMEKYKNPVLRGNVFDCGLYTLNLNGDWIYDGSEEFIQRYGNNAKGFYYKETTNKFGDNIIISYDDINGGSYLFSDYIEGVEKLMDSQEGYKKVKAESCTIDGCDAYYLEYTYEYAGFDLTLCRYSVDAESAVYNILYCCDKEDFEKAGASAKKIAEGIHFTKA